MMLKAISSTVLLASVVVLQASAALTTREDSVSQPWAAASAADPWAAQALNADVGENSKWGWGWGFPGFHFFPWWYYRHWWF
jgi:hypothetical protein